MMPSTTTAADLNQQQQQQQQQQQLQQQQMWMQYQQQQWMAMQQYPAAAAAAAMAMQQQQQQMMYQQQHYMPYHHHQQYQQQLQQQQQQQPSQIQGSSDENRTIWIGDLQNWMDEAYLNSCFAHSGEVSSVKIIRNKQTGQSEKYGFVEFLSHAAAEKVLQSFNGTVMPNTEQTFRLNWATFSTGDRQVDVSSDFSIFVGDLASDVTDAILHGTFATRYPSVKGAKVVVDLNTSRSKGYGFVRFGDENERSRAITEMNGIYCSTRPMRISIATPKKQSGNQQYSSQALVLTGGYAANGGMPQNAQSDGDLSNTTLFVGGLDSDVTDEDLRQTFSQCGEVVSVKIAVGKGWGFVQFANRNSAEDAIQRLTGVVIRSQKVRLSWDRSPGNKQYVNNAEVSQSRKRKRDQLLGASLGLKDDKQGLEQEVFRQRFFWPPALPGYSVAQLRGMIELREKGKVFEGMSDHESTAGTAAEGGVLSMEEVVQLNEMQEAVKKGPKLCPEGKESLTRVTDEVSRSSEVELLEEISLEELEEVHSVPDELEELDCDPVQVPPTISHHFSILRMLDLSYTEIKCLPQSISRLVALQKLFLRSCELLMELPPEIGELTKLEVLDLEQTEIRFLPKEIAKLVNLTCLKVSFYGYANQTVIPRRVLRNLSRLNELIIDVTPYGAWWDVEVEAIIDDLRSLKGLRTLKMYLPTAELLEDLTLIYPGLANFRFTLGRHEEHFISCLPHALEEEFNNWEKLEKGLKYVNGNCIPNEMTKVLKHANAFFLQRHWTAESLSEFGHENMNAVKFCLVMECNEFRTIIDSNQFYQGKDGSSESGDFQDFENAIVLASLEKLIILYMKNVECIWKGPVGTGSLSNLKSLALHTCPSLTTLFTIDMLSNLRNLEELIVEDCPKIDSLVSLKSSGSKLGCFLPSLKKISLLELPELTNLSSGLFIAPKLERMVIFYCPKLEKLSTMDVSSTNLKVIKGEKEWWEALKWYESDLSTEHEDFLARLFIPLRRDGDLMAQLTKD